MKAMICCFAAFGVFTLATWVSYGQPDDQENPEAGVEVQARGPIHEAFAQPTEATQKASAAVAKKPPEPIEELPPEERPDIEGVLWIPGYWAWDEDRDNYLWVSGIWRAPVPDRRWIPGYWHEASEGWQWVSGYWGPIAESVEVYPPPPEPVEEAVAPPMDTNSVYVSGIWVYRETRFFWRPGHWIAMRPGWIWTPARYCWTPAGYCFVNGCWDYDFEHRGMCFAPIYVDTRVARPNWVYRPRHLVRTEFLLGSLFVNLGRHHYHFGDYYDVAYARRGYVPWVDYRIRQTAFDPIFSYYRWSHRDQPRWETDVRAVFVDRREHQNARPPRTFALQEKLAVKDPRRAVASFAQAKTAGVRLAAVSKAQVVEFQKTAVEVRKISTSRRTIETSTHAVSPKTARTEPLKLDLPKSSIAHPKAKQAPPAEPDTPKVQDVHKDKTFKEKLPKVDPPKDKEKLPKVDPPKGKDKEKLPKVDPPKEKEKLPKVDPPKEKLPKVEPPKEKEKLPKVDPPKEKLPKVDPPKEKEKLPKVEPPKDDSPKKKDKQSKDSAAVFPPEPVEHPRLSRWEVVRREVVLATDEAWSRGGWGIVALH